MVLHLVREQHSVVRHLQEEILALGEATLEVHEVTLEAQEVTSAEQGATLVAREVVTVILAPAFEDPATALAQLTHAPSDSTLHLHHLSHQLDLRPCRLSLQSSQQPNVTFQV